MYCPKKLETILFLLAWLINFVVGYEDDNLKRSDPIVSLPKYGQLHGSIGYTAWKNRTIFQFLNVPYAESPSGSQRFEAPVPIKPWTGVRNAQTYGIQCPRFENLKEIIQKENNNFDVEDCLNMAIYSTSMNTSRPVMVFIHGGFFTNQGTDQYPPNYLMERNIVLAVVGFRLDVIGFLSTNSEEIPGNAGLMDTIQALKFIKENIEHFGGDPNQITVFGQSSGAVMVSALIISPAIPENLFQRAIIQSGSIFGNWTHSSDLAKDARAIAVAAGLNPIQSTASLNQAFKKMKVSNLLKAAQRSRAIYMFTDKLAKMGSSIAIGGPSNLLPMRPELIVKSKKFNKSIPLMIGITQTDGSYPTTMAYDFLAITNRLNNKQFLENDLVDTTNQFLDIDYDSGLFAELPNFWPNNELASGNFSQFASGLIDFLGVIVFKAPVLMMAQINAQMGGAETFLYTFDYKGEFTRFGYGADTSRYPFNGGVTHSDDLIYLFPYPPNVATLNEQDTKMAQKMLDLWTSFAINGIPKLPKMINGLDRIQWKPLNDLYGPYLHINTVPRIGNDFRREFTATSRKYYAEQKKKKPLIL